MTTGGRPPMHTVSPRSRNTCAAKTSPSLHASSMETLAIAAASAVSTPASNDESSNGYSSLLDIGQAYGIWTPGEDNSNDITGPRDLKIVEDEDECPLPINVPVNDKEKVVDHTQVRKKD